MQSIEGYIKDRMSEKQAIKLAIKQNKHLLEDIWDTEDNWNDDEEDIDRVI